MPLQSSKTSQTRKVLTFKYFSELQIFLLEIFLLMENSDRDQIENDNGSKIGLKYKSMEVFNEFTFCDIKVCYDVGR